MINDLDFDAATGLVRRGAVEKRLCGVPQLIFERLAAECGSGGHCAYVQFSTLRRALCGDDFTGALDPIVDGEAALCAGIKKLRELLIPLDCAIVRVEGKGYCLRVLPTKQKADRGRQDVAQRVATAGMRISDVADHVSDEAHRARESVDRAAARIDELMQRASRGFAAAAREFAGG